MFIAPQHIFLKYKKNKFETNTGNLQNLTAQNFNFLRTCTSKKLHKHIFKNSISSIEETVVLSKTIKIAGAIKKYYKILCKFFKKLPYNRILKKKPNKYISYLFIYFFITHDLHFFLQKLVTFLQNTNRRYQFTFVRLVKLLNQKYFLSLFNFFKIGGVYFKVSGKFGGAGGSKKLKKHAV